MSLTEETIDIPLPEECNHNSNNEIASSDCGQTGLGSTETVAGDGPTAVTAVSEPSEQSSAATLQNYHSYYSAYYASYNMPQLLPQYHYYVPVVPPVAPIIPIQQMKSALNAANDTTGRGDDDDDDEEDEDSDSDPTVAKKPSTRASNVLPIHCNDKMNLNPLIYTNIQQSPYFKNNLFQLKTYHEVIDEIFYNVKHLEPWEKGSRKIGGQTGMCGSVRGVGAGGIISTPFCILFKLFTLKLTRKQVNGLIRHKDSPYIRSLGFMYIRFTQPPQHLWQWFEPFLDDEEEVDPKAGGGQAMTIGQMCRHMLTKLDWFSTLFPRVPVPIQKDIESKLKCRDEEVEEQMRTERGMEDGEVEDEEDHEREERERKRTARRETKRSPSKERRRPSRERRRSRSRDRRSRSNDKHRSSRRSRSHSPHSHRHARGDHREREREHHRHRHRH